MKPSTLMVAAWIVYAAACVLPTPSPNGPVVVMVYAPSTLPNATRF